MVRQHRREGAEAPGDSGGVSRRRLPRTFLFKSRADIEAFLGSPVVTSLHVPATTELVGYWIQAELLPLDDYELVFDTTQRTENNTFLFMHEGRYGFRVKTPSDFVRVLLTDGS